MKTRKLFFLVVLGLLFNSIPIRVCAATINWIGTASTGNWSIASNWSPAQVPTSSDNVIISSAGKNPIIDITAQCASLDITGTIQLTLSANLTVSGTLTIEDGKNLTIPAGSTQTLTVNGKTTLLGSNTFTIDAGTVIFNSMDMMADNVKGTTITNKSTLELSGILNMMASATLALNTQINSSGTFKVGISGASFTANLGDWALISTSTTAASTFTAGNSGTPCTFNLSGNTATITNTNGTIYAGPAGAATIFNLSGANSLLNNSNILYAGTKGTPGTSCAINLSGANSSLTNQSIALFYLAPPSSINISGSGALVSNSGNSNFMIQSDATGSATIGAISGASAQIKGNYSVERFITGGSGYRGYRLLSSPVSTTATSGFYSINYLLTSCYVTGTNSTAGGFDTATGNPNNPTLYLFRENIVPTSTSFTSGNFRGINKINNAAGVYNIDSDPGNFKIYNGNGYLFFFRGDRSMATLTAQGASYVPTNTTLTANGALNQGQITVKHWYNGSTSLLETNVSGNPSINGFNLVGNPYACSIDWDKFNTSTPNSGIYSPASGVAPFIYVLMPNGSYNIYQQGQGGVSTNNGIANSNVIPSGQGFFVIASGTTPTLTFNEDAKTTAQATGSNLFLGEPAKATVSQYMHLTLAQNLVNGDGILINFNNNAKTQYVANEDAPYKTGTGPVSLSSMSADNIALGINVLPLPKQNAMTIPLNVKVNAYGTFQLNMAEMKSIPAIYEVWLMDAYKKDSADFRNHPVYNFDITTDVASYAAGRFSLVVRQNPALGVHLLNFTATKATKGSQIVWATENEQNYTNFTLQRSTDNGKTFDDLNGFLSTASGTYSFLDKNPQVPADQYRLKISDLNGTITYSKMITLSYSGLSNDIASNNINIYPNPAKSVINLSIAQNSGSSSNLSALGVLNSTPSLVSSAKDNQSYNIKIISMTGIVVRTAISQQPTWEDNISGLPPGTYIIEVANMSNNKLVGKSTFIKL